MDIFDSAVCTKGDIAGVFEHEEADGPQNATACFCLHQTECNQAGTVLGAIHVRPGQWAITEADVAVRWDSDEQRVGLFVFGALVAAFDATTGAKYGAEYGKDFNAEITWS
ncbi:MAG: hypothetical protein E5V92_07805 [Mesorhizobium sp.]|uniref:hypothetical protein n=1 Tax=unclassified Mesorhizobium TaxID=325217 RepID=UPI000F756E02|nr:MULTISPECIES: hypothetical protein [unclassified Mesorhizobium]AZO70551.1 hypothetical protein EJ067_04650 [Mesorhizobium sp. M1D.F.Ca.ET.043.01.1.1]RWA84274.1 MAG: hypothetical protein EOQ32_26945 [Mesorhizobium sp.]RWD99277.1 MAG: hypothetical protein EOS61_30480 [Mesorhizobium sp.]TJW87850.1 MAG: hypothetical protein E5V92_07805 [Mesorhizobium sp.]